MRRFTVLGAGMAGIGAALALRARGHEVTVVDRAAPGSETSFGNSGIIQAEAAEPYGMPRDLPTLWRYATGRSNDIAYRLAHLPAIAAPLWRYYRASAPARHREISRIYSRLIARVLDDHGRLIAAAGVGGLVRRDGFYRLYRDPAAFERGIAEAGRVERDYTIPSLVLDADAFRAAEPALRGPVAGAILWTGSWSTIDPGALTRAYASLFEARGGRILRGDAASLAETPGGWSVDTAEGKVDASDVVIALGPWSADFLARLGHRVPMFLKRGYHRHFRMARPLNRPLLDSANGILLAPMAAGLRITTGAELVRRSAPANPRQIERGAEAARELFDIGEPVEKTPWFGHRPCTPDMLPVVGPAPRHRGLWFDFGHGHQGLTLGPTTGELLADIVDGRDDDLARQLSPARRGLR